MKKVLLFLTVMIYSGFSHAEKATYTVTFTSLWNAADHLRLPSNAHFSPIVSVSHNSDFSLLHLGQVTRSALEPLAELGRTRAVQAEIASSRNQGNVLSSDETANF